MSKIEYIEKPVREEVFSGTYLLDGNPTKEEQREKIFDLMRMAGVPIENVEDYEISYDGVEDYDGSETQSTPFHVFHTVMKAIPYRVTRDEVFNGSFILDSITLTEEEQRQKVFDMMRLAGISLENPDQLEISYDGVEDDNGVSEIQTTPFHVYRVHRVELNPDQVISNDVKEELEASLKEIKALRSKLESIVDSKKRKELIDELYQKMDSLEETIGSQVGMSEPISNQLTEIEEQILYLQKSLKNAVKEYEDSFHRMENILEEQTKVFEGDLLSEEKLNQLREEFANRKMEENANSVRIRREIEEQKKMLQALKTKRNKMEKDLGRAEEMGISVMDLKDIDAALKKTTILNAILDQKGLEEVVDKKASERTKEEKKRLREAKEEIVHEISEAKKENKELSVLDAIEALYSLQVQYKQGHAPRVLLVKEKQLQQIIQNVDKVPERIVGNAKVYDYQPDKIPEDMKDAEISYPREEVFSGTYILDGVPISEEQQRQKIFDLMRVAGVEVEDESQYEIGYEGVEDDQGLSDTQSTKFVVYRKLPNPVKEEKVVEVPTVEDADYEESKGVHERIVLFHDSNNPGDLYVRDYVTKRFNLVPISDEVLIDESSCYQIETEDADYIIGNQNNSYSPYFVEDREVTLPKKDTVEEIVPEDSQLDKIVVYHDFDNNQEKYVNKETLQRFNLIPESDAVSINGEEFYRIGEEDANFVMNNQANSYSPYEVRYQEARLGHRMEEPQKEKVEEKDNNLIERIVFYRDLDNNNEVYVKKYVTKRFNIVPASDEVRIDGAVCYRIDNEDAGDLIVRANNNYSPYEVDVRDIALGKREVEREAVVRLEKKDLVEKIVFYRDLDNDNALYVKKYAVKRFQLHPIGSEVRIMKAACYRIREEDADFIIGNANNNYSPYMIDIIDVNLGKEEDRVEEVAPNQGILEKMSIYRDLDNHNQIYVKKYLLRRFHMEEIGPEVKIDGSSCYPISEEDAYYIVHNQNNGYSPYQLEVRNMRLKDMEKKEGRVIQNELLPETVLEPVSDAILDSVNDSIEESSKEDFSTEELPHEEICLYRNPSNLSEIYASISTLQRFGIFPSGNRLEINGESYYLIRSEDEKKIHDIAKQPIDIPLTISYYDLPEVFWKKEEEKEKAIIPTYEEVCNKLIVPTSNSNAQRFTPTNIQTSDEFKEELRRGDWVYNIVHFASIVRQASSELLQKLSKTFTSSGQEAEYQKDFQHKVDSLTDEEMEVLFKEYKDSRAFSQVNQILIRRLQEYLLDKLSVLDTKIVDQYDSLYVLLGQIRVLEESLATDGLNSRDKNDFMNERRSQLEKASMVVKEIIECRQEALKLVDSSILDDFIEIREKLPFISMPYREDLTQEVQKRIPEYQEALEEALQKDDSENIVSNFMGLESCYFEKSDVATRMVGSRSVGMKYFSPVVDEFLYKDDSFVRDFLQVFATNSALIHGAREAKIYTVGESIKKDSPQNVDQNELNLTEWNLKVSTGASEIAPSIERTIIQYGSGILAKEEALMDLENIVHIAQSQLIQVVNEILALLKPYSMNHPTFDYNRVEDALESIIAHPEYAISLDSVSKDVISEELFGLPKSLLESLISAASDVALVTHTYHHMAQIHANVQTEEDIFSQDSDSLEDVPQIRR